MDDMTHKIQSILDEVNRAFPQPEVDDEYVREHFDSLSLVEPESRLPAMLAAHLKVALEDFSPENQVCEFLAYALTPYKDWKENANWWCRRLSALNEVQVASLFEYLTLIESDPRFSYIFEQIKRSLPRLKELWKMTQSNQGMNQT